MNKELLCAAVEKHRREILETSDWVWKHPETGFKEFQTSAYMEKLFEDAGYTLVRAGDIPGFYADIDTGKPGPKVLIMGELDALPLPTHFQAVNGNAHACGHNVQCAGLAGVALALKEPGVMDGLCGSVRLMAVPAEELVEIEFRNALKKEGKLHSCSGKAEFLYRGMMDGVDIAYMFHATTRTESLFDVNYGNDGILSKEITYTGKASHAGGSPQNGINALYAASLGLQAINAVRETFVEKDYIRVHPIITEAGQATNIIPAKAHISTYVRGASWDAILAANKRVNRAIAGSALSVGAKVVTEDASGYTPFANDPGLSKLAAKVMADLLGEENVDYNTRWNTGSTDMGELAMLMPVIHPHISTSRGTSHGDDYVIDRPEGIVNSSKGQLMLLHALLENDAAEAKNILAGFTPVFNSKEEYFEFMDSLNRTVDMVDYTDTGAVVQY